VHKARSKNSETDQNKLTRIKKYPNRRLYNTSTSAYIVLDDVVALVKSGAEFIIEDAKSGEDITRSILNQVIFEKEMNGSEHHFPLEVQKQLIGMYDDTYARMVPEYLKESMQLFMTQRDQINSQFEDAFELNARAIAQFNETLMRQNMEIFNRTFEFFQSMSGMAPTREETAPDDAASGEASELQSQIKALQKRLEALNR